MMITKSMIEKIGVFDPLFFMYKEEHDLCRRAHCHNFKVVVVTNSKIFHWHSLTQATASKEFNNYHLLRSQLIYLLKDPHRNFLRNFVSYCKLLLFQIITPKSIKFLIRNCSIHFWVFCHLPVIAVHQYKQRCKNKCPVPLKLVQFL